jgi:hypothetical protein
MGEHVDRISALTDRLKGLADDVGEFQKVQREAIAEEIRQNAINREKYAETLVAQKEQADLLMAVVRYYMAETGVVFGAE